MNEFYDAMKQKYDVKRLGRPKRYLLWHCHYYKDGSMELSQRLEVDKTLQHATMLGCNGNHTPFPSNTDYRAPNEHDTELSETLQQYRKLMGDLRNIAESTRPDVTFVVQRLGAAMSKPIFMH